MWYFVIIVISLIYIILNVIIKDSIIETYLFKPLIWLVLGIITIIVAYYERFSIFKIKKKKSSNLGRTWTHTGFILGGFHVSMLLIAGLLFGFGKPPYGLNPNIVLINSFFIGAFLFGTESSRAYLIKRATLYSKKNISLKILGITILFTFLYFSFYEFSNITLLDKESVLMFIGGKFIPIISINLLSTYLSYEGRATASIAYVGFIFAFNWFSPISPNPHWIILALVNTLAAGIGFFLINENKKIFMKRNLKIKIRNEAVWTFIAIFTVIIIFFSYGFFGFKPTVVYSESMKPEYNIGDLVLVENFKQSSIKKDDIIQFIKSEDEIILHRVIEVKEGNSGVLYTTKGDANRANDTDPVTEEQILGKAIFKIPFVGWMHIYLRDFFERLTRFF